MPLYEYQCQECHAAFEVRATFAEKQAGLRPVCPECGSPKARQVITSGLLIRVGSGERGPACGCGPNGGPGCCS